MNEVKEYELEKTKHEVLFECPLCGYKIMEMEWKPKEKEQ